MNDRLVHTRLPRTGAALGLILTTTLIGTTTVQACPGLDWQGGPDMDVGSKIESMAKRLDLTPEQQAQVRAILEQTRQEQRRLRQESRAQIEALLTEEQKAKRAERQARAVNRQVERLTDWLELSNEQADRIKTLLTEQRQNPELTRAELYERMSAILTAEQRAEFEQGRGRGLGGDRRGRGDGCLAD
ncbi:Spy/CpxP family protein refolding chaperone [Thermochromatium tepidum]|nr:periplasmic heavy metal sensor [Thermochromatium tepidum]